MRQKNKKGARRSEFERPDDPWWNPDNEEDYNRAYGGEDGQEEEMAININQTFVQAFIDEFQPEHDEREQGVYAFGLGELRDKLHIYRTFDCKTPDPLPYYLDALAAHGFSVKLGFSGEMTMLVRRRNNGRGIQIKP